MPDSSRSSVDFPAPLCPTSPTRSPISSDIVMSRSASMTTTLDSLRPIAPPALPRKAFFSERDLASKMGNSTHALRVSMMRRLRGGVHVPTGTDRSRWPPPRCPVTPRRQRALAAHLLELWRAAICWANSAVWMPWNRPSSQPTSCACAMRSSASDGIDVLGERQRQALELVAQLGRQPLLQLADAACGGCRAAGCGWRRPAVPPAPPRAAA